MRKEGSIDENDVRKRRVCGARHFHQRNVKQQEVENKLSDRGSPETGCQRPSGTRTRYEGKD